MKVSKKIACISLVEILKLVRISLKNENESHVCTLHILFMIHILQHFLWVIARKVGTYINFGKRVNYNLGRLVNFGIKTENPS